MAAVIHNTQSAVGRRVPERSDEDIARNADIVLRGNPLIPVERITVDVTDGLVTLKGSARWRVQKMFAEAVIKKLKGISGVRNDIEIRPQDFSGEVRPENGTQENGLYQETGQGE
jgi:osmotically-inducible protein OsmY